MVIKSLVVVLGSILIFFLSVPAIAGSYRCRWETKWYTCDYVFSGKYMTIYRGDGKEFTFYRDALDEQTTNWYETEGKRRFGYYVSVTLNNGRNALRLFLSDGKELAILEMP